LPATLLEPSRIGELADAIVRASREWGFSLHINKGLAGAPPDRREELRTTAIHPEVAHAFALAIAASVDSPMATDDALPLDREAGRARAQQVIGTIAELRKLAPGAGAYSVETSYFEKNWQNSFWGPNYPRLLEIKRSVDPQGLLVIHHGVGSEGWSADGFSRTKRDGGA
jgi:hypothetical protein